MSTQTPNAARRVLGDLNVNTPITTSPTKKGAAVSPSPSKGRILATTTSQHAFATDEQSSIPVLPSAEMGGKKRTFDMVDGTGFPRFPASPERRNDGDAGLEKQLAESPRKLHGQREADELSNVDTQLQSSSDPHTTDIIPESPRSPFGFSFSQDIAIDSQSTAVTEPEATETETEVRAEDIEPAPSRVFQLDEARRQAETLRMRLQVAMYKIKTNQTDLPLSRLQVRPINTRSPSTPRETPRTISHISVHPSSSQIPAPILARQASAGMYHGQSKLRDGTSWEPASPTDSVSTSSSDIHIDIEALRRKRVRRDSEITVKASEQGTGLQGKAADGLMSLMSMSQG